MSDCIIYWFGSDGGQYRKCYWDLSSLGCRVVNVYPPKMIDDVRPWEKIMSQKLETLIKKHEGDQWESAKNTKNRVFLGHSGGVRGCLLAAAKHDGPWCGLVIGWAGWSNPDEIFTDDITIKMLKENLECSDDGNGDFMGWKKSEAPQVLLFVEPRNNTQVSGCSYRDAMMLKKRIGTNNINIIEADNIGHDTGIEHYLPYLYNYIHNTIAI
jgi:hypothetical protein